MDLAIRPIAKSEFDAAGFDLALDGGGDLASDEGFISAVLVSLFSDRRAEESDALPHGESDRRGWWGDLLDGDRIGSRLWLLEREKTIEGTRLRAIDYCGEALAWMVEDGLAKGVEVTAAYASGGRLNIAINISREGRVDGKFGLVWQRQHNQLEMSIGAL